MTKDASEPTANKSQEAHDAAEAALQRSVDRAVPDAEKLPGKASENPISQQVRESADKTHPKPGEETLKGSTKATP